MNISFAMSSDHSSPRLLAATIVLLTLTTACRHEPANPTLLVEADSAFVLGDYRCADSLLAAFDQQTVKTETGRRTDGAVLAYRQYLTLTRKYVRERLTDEDFSLADSLCRYYNKRGTRQKRGRSLLFLGDIYRLTDDNPSALNCYLQAEKLARQTGSTILMAWACQHIGDTYFDQRMLDDCKAYYRRFFQIAEARHDTLRMAHASQRMGLVFTIESKVDSIIFYYKQAIALAKDLPQANDIVPITRANLCDIYTQIEEYDEAARIMPHDSLNAYNWAYWHLGQNHVDSAVFYFKKLLPISNIRSRVDYLRILIHIAKGRGNFLLENQYYECLIKAVDSLHLLSQAEETRKTHAQYNYNSITQERDRLVSKQKSNLLVIATILAILLIVSVLSYVAIRRLKAQKEKAVIRAELLRKDMQESNEEANRSRVQLESIGIELDETRKQSIRYYMRGKELEEKLLSAEKRLAEAKHEREELKIEQFRDTHLYRLLTHQCDTDAYKLTSQDWQELSQAIDTIYDHFTSRLMALTNMSITELRICYLIKLNIPVSDIAVLLNKTVGAISHARGRLWKNISGEKESAEKMDHYLRVM
jgi:tetratricopeptide (TPR) repeat protein